MIPHLDSPRDAVRRAAAAMLAVLLQAWAPAAAAAPCKLSAIELPVTLVGSRAIATVDIAGVKVPLMVDSGAFFSFLTDAAAAQLKLTVVRAPAMLDVRGLTGEVDARMTTVDHLKLLKSEIPNVDFLVGGNEPGAGAMGLLGRNLLTTHDVEFDLAHGMVRLMLTEGECRGPGLAYWAGQSPVMNLPLRRESREVDLPLLASASLNGHDVTVEFDTGATSTVSLAAAHRAGVEDASLTDPHVIHGAGRGEAKAWTAPVARFELGGEVIENNRIEVADFDNVKIDMLLGIDFFLAHRIYVSRIQHRMFFTYNGGAVFSRNAADREASPASGADDGEPLADAAAYARRGAASAARHDDVRALADLDRACALAPEKAEYFTRRAVVHQALKQGPDALRDFDTALRLDPGQPEARLDRAWWRAGQGDTAGALDDLQALDAALPAQAAQRREMARYYARVDRPELSIAQWNLWVPAHPNDVDLDSALDSRCWARMVLGVDLDKAREDCDTAIESQPKNAAFLGSRGWLHLRQRDWRGAIADYDRALQIRADAAWSLYGRGIARLHQGEAERGQADLAAARKALPSIDAETHRQHLDVDASL